MSRLSFAERLKNLFKSDTSSDSFFEDLTDNLIEGDVGAKTAFEITEILEKRCKEKHLSGDKELGAELKEILLDYVRETELVPAENSVNIWMVLGVNGVGKTTSVAKLGNYFKKQGVENVVLASADTFRAAAIEQLAMHGEKIGLRVVSHQHGSDPAAVVFDAAEACKAKKSGLVIADTAGRLHNKENLVRELQKIDKICRDKADAGCYKKILVVDATTGQNALRQAEVFNDAVGLDAIILTKYDSTAKGGVAVSVGKELGLPVAFVCDGEKYENIDRFNAEKYIEEFIGL
ncbi:MAG: signal recognition particle-docking protein FtsY [Treponema sp.]|nr:signal recognition particle-docking protein FtsY [Treponema sp.]